MQEIEVKILEIDVDDVIHKLEALGMKKTFEGEVEVVFYDYPNELLRNSGRSLRLRNFGERAELTFKNKISQDKVKIVEEYQTNVSNFQEMKTIFEQIDLQIRRSYSKNRISYAGDGVFFEIDTINGCPPLMEIEAKSAEEVFKWAKRLGFSEDQAKPWSGTEVVAYYKDKQKNEGD